MRLKGKIWSFVKHASSLRFSIFLLLLLAFSSFLGTIIEQDQSLNYYRLNYSGKNQIFSFVTWTQILFFGLNHVYSTYWFFAILLLFFLSLLLCTFSTQLPVLKTARRWNFLYSQAALKSKSSYHHSSHTSLLNFVYILSLKNYYVFHKRQAIYAYKGIASRIAPIFVHFSIVFTLIGSVIGFTNGFTAQEIITNGEMFHVQNFVKSGYFSSTYNNLLGRVDDFFLVFNHDQSIQQFFSNISIIDNKGGILLKKSISVNTPLRFKSTTFYQTDWKIVALRMKIGSNSLLVKSLKYNSSNDIVNSPFWFNSLAFKNYQVFVVIPNLNDKLLIYSNTGDLIHVTRYGLWNVIYGVPIVFKDIMSSTGIQIKADPGISLTYLGFLILMFSIFVSYFSYSQIWASKNNNSFYFSGSTNRAFLTFEDEIVLLHTTYMNLL